MAPLLHRAATISAVKMNYIFPSSDDVLKQNLGKADMSLLHVKVSLSVTGSRAHLIQSRYPLW